MSVCDLYELRNQRIALAVDIVAQTFGGFTELSIRNVTDKPQKQIALHCRLLHVSKVCVAGREVKFTLQDYVKKMVPDGQEKLRELRTLGAYQRKAFEMSSNQGELKIAIDEDMIWGPGEDMTVKVFYEYVQGDRSSSGVVFGGPNDAGSQQSRFMYTNGRYGDAPCWVPCLNNPKFRGLFTLEITVSSALVVVGSGKLVSKIASTSGDTVVHTFESALPCCISNVLVAVGPFTVWTDPTIVEDEALPPVITHFALDSVSEDQSVSHTSQLVVKAIRFFQGYLGRQYPAEGFSSIFIPHSVERTANGYLAAAIFSSSLLYSPRIVDQHFETGYCIALAVAEQWVNGFVHVNSWSNIWIVQALSHFLASVFYREHFGRNASRYRLMETMDALLKMPQEIISQPLYTTSIRHPSDLFHPYFSTKSLLIMYMIERRIGDAVMKQDVLKMLFTPCMVNDAPPDGTNTLIQSSLPYYTSETFITLIADATRYAMDDILTYWINRGGYPSLQCGFAWNSKRRYLEFAVKQDFVVSPFAGSLPFRVYEFSKAYNHAIEFSEHKNYAWDDFPIHTRPTEKNTVKRKKKVTQEDGTVIEVEGEQTKVEAPVLYIRIDPDEQWIMSLEFNLPEEMYISLLEAERDVPAERSAVRGLLKFPGERAINVLSAVLNDADRYVSTRAECAKALAAMVGPETENLALSRLVSHFMESFYMDTDGKKILLPNDFADLSSYRMKCALVRSMGSIRDATDSTPVEIVKIIVDLLAFNDNATNRYDDSVYLRTIMGAAGKIKSSNELMAKLEAQQERYIQLIAVIPSYHNDVALGVLEWEYEWQLLGNSQRDEGFFQDYMQQSYPQNVRNMATKCYFKLLLTKYQQPKLLSELKSLISIALKDKDRMYTWTFLDDVIKAIIKQNEKLRYEVEEYARRLFVDPAVPENVAFGHMLWEYVAGGTFHGDSILRKKFWGLYAALWGLETPKVFKNEAIPETIITAFDKRDLKFVIDKGKAKRQKTDLVDSRGMIDSVINPLLVKSAMLNTSTSPDDDDDDGDDDGDGDGDDGDGEGKVPIKTNSLKIRFSANMSATANQGQQPDRKKSKLSE